MVLGLIQGNGGLLEQECHKAVVILWDFLPLDPGEEELVAKGHIVGALLLIDRLGLCKCLL